MTVESGVPVSCTCKADEYGSGDCKHRVAIAIHEPVLAAVSARGPDGKRALADGGTVVDPKIQGENAETTHTPGAIAQSVKATPATVARCSLGSVGRCGRAHECPRACCDDDAPTRDLSYHGCISAYYTLVFAGDELRTIDFCHVIP